MVKLKNVILNNFCGYKHLNLDFSDNGGVKKWIVFCGPNGIGKSNFIRAVEILTHTKYLQGRENSRLLRKLKYNKNYISQLSNIQSDVSDLKMEAVFVSGNNEEKRVIVEDTYKGILGTVLDETLSPKEKELRDWDKKYAISGITLNELQESENNKYSICIDADNPNNMHKFQIYKEIGDAFINFAESVYGFKCYLPKESVAVDNGIEYYTDFILHKHWDTKVHYKSFSDGEKKIATLLSTLFKKCYHSSPGRSHEKIILIDNIEMHIYHKRHMLLVNKMEEFFPDHQIICTTHSPIIIKELDEKYIYDIENILNIEDDNG